MRNDSSYLHQRHSAELFLLPSAFAFDRPLLPCHFKARAGRTWTHTYTHMHAQSVIGRSGVRSRVPLIPNGSKARSESRTGSQKQVKLTAFPKVARHDWIISSWKQLTLWLGLFVYVECDGVTISNREFQMLTIWFGESKNFRQYHFHTNLSKVFGLVWIP